MRRVINWADYKDNWQDYGEAVADIVLDVGVAILLLILIPIAFVLVLAGFAPTVGEREFNG